MKPLTFILKANQNNNNNCDGKIWNNKQLIKLTKRQAREKITTIRKQISNSNKRHKNKQKSIKCLIKQNQ